MKRMIRLVVFAIPLAFIWMMWPLLDWLFFDKVDPWRDAKEMTYYVWHGKLPE